MTDQAPPVVYTVSVRELCEFTAKRGDLDMRFTPSPSAEQGMAGHFKVSLRRGSAYEREIPLERGYQTLRVRGRADGYNAGQNALEEIKTFRGHLDRMPENHRALHWAQLKLYGAMLCADRGLQDLQLNLVYFDIRKEKETVLSQTCTASELETFFQDHCQRFLLWSQQESVHRNSRDAAMAALKFPFADFHSGQRTLSEACFRAARDGYPLMVQAPTGIGKTVGTLFPVLKTCATRPLDRIFYLTAKTSGRKLALDALQVLQETASSKPLRVLELTAREKTCEHPDKACHGESCPLASGFYDRLPAARAQAAQAESTLDQASLRHIALAHDICPYYLSQEMARWSDVVVGDYNYYFDTSALLHAMSIGNEWNSVVLVDEAHNLVERARSMYSASLDPWQFAAARKIAPRAFKSSLDRINREWNRMARDQEQAYEVRDALPLSLIDALDKFATVINDYLSDQAEPLPAILQTFYFECLQFRAMAEVFAEHSIFDVSLQGGARDSRKQRAIPCIRNVVPAPFTRERIRNAHAAILFSATLRPQDFYQDLLGLPNDTRGLDVPTPFSAEQLQVNVASNISTRYRQREQSLLPIAELIAQQYRRCPGNYLAFFSSFDYLADTAQVLQSQFPDVPLFAQHRAMRESERAAFVARFTNDSSAVGFAVLGGAFAEGIDLPGNRLIGAFVASLGLPQFNPVNEQIMQRIETLFEGRGYDYTYLFPGVQKVVQAAGRVIRSTSDEGVLYLIDDRYARRAVRSLLPAWWKMQTYRPVAE